jgi:YidC/Oxa1 family membrane protein insertase
MGDIWNLLILNPMLNSLLFLYQLLFNNFTLTILVFTVLIRLITYPLTYQQQKSTRKLAELQRSDAWKKMQEKFGKDKEKMAQEQMKLYQEAGVNPFGSCLPTLIQFPVLIGLYQAINLAMAASPVALLDLSTHIYNFLPNAARLVPLQNNFLWLNLGLPDPFYLLPLIVVATTWLQSRVMTPATAGADPQAAQMSQSMAITMPLMIGWMSLQFPSGLSIYWVVSNAVSVVQYAIASPVDWKNVLDLRSFLGGRRPTKASDRVIDRPKSRAKDKPADKAIDRPKSPPKDKAKLKG